jgi:hypothetical protein
MVMMLGFKEASPTGAGDAWACAELAEGDKTTATAMTAASQCVVIVQPPINMDNQRGVMSGVKHALVRSRTPLDSSAQD